MVKREIVKSKIDRIEYCLNRIYKFKKLNLNEFLEDEDAKDIIVHNLFIIIQNLIDIGNHIISDESLGEPIFTSDIADILNKNGVIKEDLVSSFKSMIGLRNIIAHEYSKIDFNIIYNIYQKYIDDVKGLVDDFVMYSKL